MKIIYAKKSSGIDEQGSFQNPSYYDKPNKDAESVVIYGDYPQIKADYEELGIQVEVRELPKSGLIQGEPVDLTGLVPVEQFDAVALDLTNTKEQLATAQGELISFKNDVGAMQARITELQSVDYTKLKVDELKDVLKLKGIEFSSDAKKDDLLALLIPKE